MSIENSKGEIRFFGAMALVGLLGMVLWGMDVGFAGALVFVSLLGINVEKNHIEILERLDKLEGKEEDE